jgi:CheY-like chemotaxis protein
VSEVEEPSILVVEDDRRNMILARAILGRRRCRVVAADSLAQARQQIAGGTPDLILLDVRLPDGNGLELARELKANPATEGVPVIAVSASVLPADRAAVEAAGCDGFMVKPLHPEKVLEEIARHLGEGWTREAQGRAHQPGCSSSDGAVTPEPAG